MMGRKQRVFMKAIDRVLTAGAKAGHLNISAAYIEGEGDKVILTGGEESVAISPDTAIWLADTWSSPLALLGGLGPVVKDLREAAEVAKKKGAELRASMN